MPVNFTTLISLYYSLFRKESIFSYLQRYGVIILMTVKMVHNEIIYGNNMEKDFRLLYRMYRDDSSLWGTSP